VNKALTVFRGQQEQMVNRALKEKRDLEANRVSVEQLVKLDKKVQLVILESRVRMVLKEQQEQQVIQENKVTMVQLVQQVLQEHEVILEQLVKEVRLVKWEKRVLKV
jgi:hypothetical protein